MTLQASSQSPKKVKTATNIPPYSGNQESLLQIPAKKEISPLGLLEGGGQEQIIQCKPPGMEKPIKITQLKKLPNTIILTQAEQANIYDRDLTPETNPDDKTSIQLSFGQRH